MKKTLVVLGWVFLALILLVACGIGYIAIKGSALDKEAKAYVDDAVPEIIGGGWHEDALKARISPEFQRVTTDADLDKLFDIFKRLGTLKSYHGSKGDTFTAVNIGSGTQITANYRATADFDSGPAGIDIGLIKHGDQWQILRFRVDSRALFDQR